MSYTLGKNYELGRACSIGDMATVSKLVSENVTLNNIEYRGMYPSQNIFTTRSPIQNAIFSKHTNIVEFLIQKGADLEFVDPTNYTPLHWACFEDQPVAIALLCAAGANTEALDFAGQTPMQVAVARKNKKAIAALLKQEKVKAVCQAAYKGDLNLIKKIRADMGGDVEILSGIAGTKTPLMWACQHGQTDVVAYLILQQVDLNVRNDVRWTALHFCSFYNRPVLVKMLLEAGCDINAFDSNNKSAYDCAKLKKSAEVMAVFDAWPAKIIAAPKKETPNLSISNSNSASGGATNSSTGGASSADKSPKIPRAMTKNVSVQEFEIKDEMTQQQLNCALAEQSEKGRLDRVIDLIDKGAVVDNTDHKSRTPLMHASYAGKADVVKLLISKGSDLSLCNDIGWTALHFACFYNQAEVVRALVVAGAVISLPLRFRFFCLLLLVFICLLVCLFVAGGRTTMRRITTRKHRRM